MDSTKEKRNKAILKMYNDGTSIATIAKKFNLSKPGVHSIIKSRLPDPDSKEVTAQPKETIKTGVTSNKGERITNLGEYVRTGVNEYTHKNIGEVINIKFIKATKPNEYGYFVKV